LTCIYQNDIEGIDEQSDTAILVHCPYCHTAHTAERVEWNGVKTDIDSKKGRTYGHGNRSTLCLP
jgi:hypothetical protein